MLASLPEAKVKPIFEESQYRNLKRQFDQAKGLGVWLKQNGFVPDEADRAECGDTGPGRPARVMIRAIPLAPAAPARKGE